MPLFQEKLLGICPLELARNLSSRMPGKTSHGKVFSSSHYATKLPKVQEEAAGLCILLTIVWFRSSALERLPILYELSAGKDLCTEEMSTGEATSIVREAMQETAERAHQTQKWRTHSFCNLSAAPSTPLLTKRFCQLAKRKISRAQILFHRAGNELWI